MRRFFAELSAIVVSAALCAAGSNFLAGRERKLTPVGRYPNPLVVPKATAPLVAAPEPPLATPAGVPAGSAAVPAPAASPAVASASSPRTPIATGPLPKGAAPGLTPAPASFGPKAAPSTLAAPAASAAGSLQSRFPPHPDRPFVEISGADALWAHARGARFLDARRTKVYEEGHIAGALSFAVWESDVDQKVFAFQDEVPAKDQPIVLYCSGGECEDSHMLADKMFGVGFVTLLVYRDGWPDWQKRAGPARSGSTP